MLDQGLPESLRDPLLFLLTKRLSAEDGSVVRRVETIRARMRARGDDRVRAYRSPEPGSAGIDTSPTARPEPGELRTIPLHWIARWVSVPAYWGSFLHLCARATRAGTILELGGCAGISGCYLASSPTCTRFVTIEGSSDLAGLAGSNLRQIADHAVVVNSLFDAGLDQILPTFADGLDLVHIDGQHEKVATLHYLERLIPHLNPGALVVFDDIHWTDDMLGAWGAVGRRPGIASTVDVGRFGLAIWGPGAARFGQHSLARFADFWGPGQRQFPDIPGPPH
ncbi:MAG: class I SAM-dependent methyltransferase [Chloroflexi bacterium]|nr:class I SAM-dependent methyltransferase [Chloroflexota bacterium]